MHFRTYVIPFIILTLCYQLAYSDWTLNKFNCKKCDSILMLNNDASKTLREIMAATKVNSCSEFKVDSKGVTSLNTIDLHRKSLTDLSPFLLFRFVDGSIDLSHNNISDIEPLIIASHGLYRINLSHNNIKDASYLAKHFNLALVLDSNEIDDPSKLGDLSLQRWFSIRGNHSKRGPDYDNALESLYRFYALFSKDYFGEKKVDFSGMKQSLAPKLIQYISLKNVTVENVIDDAERFYNKKGDVEYIIHLKNFNIEKQNGSILASCSLSYHWNDFDFNLPDDDENDYSRIYRTKKVEASVKALFDSTFHIVSYIENLPPRKKYLVTQQTSGMVNIADVVKILSFQEVSNTAEEIKLPAGSILKADFESAGNHTGNKYGKNDEFGKFIYNGKSIWIRTSSSEDDEDNFLKNL
jgi:hypothetical protein